MRRYARTVREWLARRRRAVRIIATIVGLLVVAWVFWGYFFIISPQVVKHPRRADAVFVLGPYLNGRSAQAIALAERLDIPRVFFSVGDTPGQVPGPGCVTAPATISVTCFVPQPYTTRGEARELGRLAHRYDWHNVIVLAPQPQISRARMLIGRCYGGSVQMVQTPDEFSFTDLVGQFFYQSLATAKAVVLGSC